MPDIQSEVGWGVTGGVARALLLPAPDRSVRLSGTSSSGAVSATAPENVAFTAAVAGAVDQIEVVLAVDHRTGHLRIAGSSTSDAVRSRWLRSEDVGGTVSLRGWPHEASAHRPGRRGPQIHGLGTLVDVVA